MAHSLRSNGAVRHEIECDNNDSGKWGATGEEGEPMHMESWGARAVLYNAYLSKTGEKWGLPVQAESIAQYFKT